MLDRRTFLQFAATLPALSQAGCGVWVDAENPHLVPPVIDVHAHFFNGRDVPVAGFLEQVVLRDPHEPVGSEDLRSALIGLLTEILLQSTMSAADELSELRSPEPRVARAGGADFGDQQAVANAILGFSTDLFTAPAGPDDSGATARGQAELRDSLTDETGVDLFAVATETELSPPEMMAAAIYEKDARGRYLRRSPLVQTIRWAGLLTRPRQEIMREYRNLYAGDGRVTVVSPYLVDFELWFPRSTAVSPVKNQIELMAEIAQRNADPLILNFVGFCPIRATLLAREERDPLELVRFAVEERGFAGVKLYPPVGFLPAGNSSSTPYGAQRGRQASAAEVNDALDRLYNWCSRSEVPIAAHAANSNGAGECTGWNASPRNWASVLQKHPELRLSLAHFGGFREEINKTNCPRPDEPNWEDLLAELAQQHEGIFADNGYWTEAYRDDPAGYDRVQSDLKALLLAAPVLGRRLMFATDWSMLGRDPKHPEYLGAMVGASNAAGLSETALFSRNAIAFLGLIRGTKQYDRLTGFFGADRIDGVISTQR
jgi:predicted TIM-barrel fold metal-dependent hydrolase